MYSHDDWDDCPRHAPSEYVAWLREQREFRKHRDRVCLPMLRREDAEWERRVRRGKTYSKSVRDVNARKVSPTKDRLTSKFKLFS